MAVQDSYIMFSQIFPEVSGDNRRFMRRGLRRALARIGGAQVCAAAPKASGSVGSAGPREGRDFLGPGDGGQGPARTPAAGAGADVGRGARARARTPKRGLGLARERRAAARALSPRRTAGVGSSAAAAPAQLSRRYFDQF